MSKKIPYSEMLKNRKLNEFEKPVEKYAEEKEKEGELP